MLKFYKGLSSKEIVLKVASYHLFELRMDLEEYTEKLTKYSNPHYDMFPHDREELIDCYTTWIKDKKDELKLIQDAIKEVKG